MDAGSTSLFAFAAAVMAGMAAFLAVPGWAWAVRRRVLRERLARFVRPADAPPPVPGPAPWLRPVRGLGGLLARRLGEGPLAAARLRLHRAGEPGGLTVEDTLGLRAICAAVGIALAAVGGRAEPPFGPALALLSLALGASPVDAFLAVRASARRREVRRALPDFVDLLYLCLGAGMGFDNAAATIAARMPGPLSAELRRYLSEVGELGASRAAALTAMAARVGSDELTLFANAVIRSMEMGAGLLNTAGAQARLLRHERRQHADAMARRAPIHMLVPMTLLILPVLMLVVLGPVMLRLLGAMKGVQL